jgi:anti-sigma factor RsiW
LNCNSVILEISNYIDGDVEVAMKREIELHLEHCQDCAMVVIQMKLTVEIFCDSQAVALPPDVRSRLHDALQQKIRKPGT